MKMAIKRNTPIFSLADQLFNRDSVRKLSTALAAAHPGFRQQAYEKNVLKAFPDLELKQRINCLVEELDEHLPGNFEEALDILEAALPEPLDPDRTDDDFGEFIWVVPGEYVARHGVSESRVDRSLAFLETATQRFSSEIAIRPFLAAFPERTLAFAHGCAQHDNYHVRRLASEGIRPYLPWALRVVLPPEDVVGVLDHLHADRTRYVTRSVANTLNDLSRDHPSLVLQTLRRWHKQQAQRRDELDWMTRHALRTLIKNDHPDALSLLGYPVDPAFRVSGVTASEVVRVGEGLRWQAELISRARQNLKIALRVFFRKADGSLSPRVFAVKDVALDEGERLVIDKSIAFKPLSTRTLYPGVHEVELVVNGVARARRKFDVKA